MKIFSEELVEKAVQDLHIADLSKATIGEVLLVAQYLEKQTGIPFVRMALIAAKGEISDPSHEAHLATRSKPKVTLLFAGIRTALPFAAPRLVCSPNL